jgi:hypothetical protein
MLLGHAIDAVSSEFPSPLADKERVLTKDL